MEYRLMSLSRRLLRSLYVSRKFSVSEKFEAVKQFQGDSDGNWNQRFRSKQITLSAKECNSAVDALERIKHAIKKGKLHISPCEYGIIVVTKYSLIIPIHNSVIQPQHVVFSDVNLSQKIDAMLIRNTKVSHDQPLPVNAAAQSDQWEDLSMTICYFFDRGFSSNVAEEREIDVERLKALNDALKEIVNISGEGFLTDSTHYSSPAQKIYKSYVMPRVNRKHKIEPVDISARRVALQISLILRQKRADEASSYLRNTDKSVPIEKLLSPKEPNPIILLLDNVRASSNVGNLFRTAETAGVTELITCGISPHPPHPKLNKTALGSTDIVPNRHVSNALQTIQELKQKGYFIVAMETATTSKCYTDIQYPKNVVVVVGNEVVGVDPLILQEADVIAEIPMFGIKNSLNVSAAAPVVLFEILRQWTAK